MSQSTTDTICDTYGRQGPSAAVVEAVARAEGVDPTEIERPLYEVVDPDALDDLFSSRHVHSPASGIRVSFTYYGYEIQVRGDGDVTLERE